MAIYHLRAKVIQRSAGQSAVKSAAYRHGERLYDDRLERSFSYRKPDVVHSEIIAPEGAADWAFSRYELWNRAERAETRINSQPAREIELTLPVELSRDQQVALVRSFISDFYVAKGMVADIALHETTDTMGRPQPHAHVMLTMRRLDHTTMSGFARAKAREWNENPAVEEGLREAKEEFRKGETPERAARVAELDSQRNINVWRKGWADYANQALANANSMARIDHRTLKAQGIDREPQTSLGIARHIERAYDYIKDRVGNWLSILKRNELRRAFAPYEARSPEHLIDDVSTIASLTDAFVDLWRRRPRDIQPKPPEITYDA